MTQIWERLWVGGLDDAEWLAGSNPHNITTVITLCEECVRPKRRGVRYIHLPIEDAMPIPLGQFDAIIAVIVQNMFRGTVLIHCGEGVSRAPSITAAYMHSVGHKSFNAALAEIKGLRSFINPSRTLLESIRRELA